MRYMIGLVVAWCVAATATAANAGAFGIEMGTPTSKLVVQEKTSEHAYKVVVPTPNPEFESYLVTATPETGVCKIIAIGRSHHDDGYGQLIRPIFSSFQEILTAKYGRSKDYDFIRYGALWNEPRDWAMSVLKNERTLASFWSSDMQSTLPTDIDSIGLQVKSVSMGSTYINLSYEFSNFDRCVEIIKQKSDAGL